MAVATNYETYRWKGAIEPRSSNTYDTNYSTYRWKGALEPVGNIPEVNPLLPTRIAR